MKSAWSNYSLLDSILLTALGIATIIAYDGVTHNQWYVGNPDIPL